MWKQVDVAGNLHSLVRGDRAGRVEKDGGQYEARIGRRRGTGAGWYWTWETVGRAPSVEAGKELVEARLPAELG
jgi:hypothetical protein